MDLTVYIFSYNRGRYLKNCMESIWRNMPNGCHIVVYDDRSTDAETVDYLRELSNQGIDIKYPDAVSTERHGAYYLNLQSALEECKTRHALFLQDDTQVVRRVTASELERFLGYFGHFLDLGFISPVFMKGRKKTFFFDSYKPKNGQRFYVWVNKNDPTNVPRFYADISLIFVERLRKIKWEYASSENENGKLARHHFSEMLQLADPFVFYVPDELAYRSKVLTLGAKAADYIKGSNVKSFHDMSESENNAFLSRELTEYPFAEDFLRTIDPKVRKPYKFNVYRSNWAALIMNKIELWMRGLR